MSKPLPWPLVPSAPWPVSKYRPKRPVRFAACRRIFSTLMSNTALASATPARLWNHKAIDVARHRVRAEHDVADGVRPAVEHLDDDVLGIVGRRVGLRACAHVASGAE